MIKNDDDIPTTQKKGRGESIVIDATKSTKIWDIKKSLCLRYATRIENVINYGLYIPGEKYTSKCGKWLAESRTVYCYFKNMKNSTRQVDIAFIPKVRYVQGETTKDFNGVNTPRDRKKFMSYVIKGQIDKVKSKCENGFDPNFTTADGTIPLIYAASQNNHKMVHALVAGGAFVDYRLGPEYSYKTALHIAAENEYMETIETLLKCGCNINIEDSEGRTPIFYAINAGHSEVVMNLIIMGAEVNHMDSKMRMPLHHACIAKNQIITLILIDNQADMNAGNNVGNTPLHVAAANSAVECAVCLLTRGCNKRLKNKSGQTAYQIASLSGNLDIKKLIKDTTEDVILPPPPKATYRNSRLIVGSEFDSKSASEPSEKDSDIHSYKVIIDESHISANIEQNIKEWRHSHISSRTSQTLRSDPDNTCALADTEKEKNEGDKCKHFSIVTNAGHTDDESIEGYRDFLENIPPPPQIPESVTTSYASSF